MEHNEEKMKEFEENKKRFLEENVKKVDNSFERIRDILKKGDNGTHNENYIARQLHEKENLRKVFLALVRFSPSLISEISEEALLTKPTCYSQLFKLVELKLCDRIFVMPIINGTIQNDEIKEKYVNWVKNMPDALKRYYLAKTSYWVITDFGKKFAERAWNFHNEFKLNGDGKND